MPRVTQRYQIGQEQVRTFTTQQLRDNFLMEDLFIADQVSIVYTHYDRVIFGGIKPVSGPVELTGFPEVRSDDFFAGREAGIVNVGGKGSISIGGDEYVLPHGACLYVGRGSANPVFTSTDIEEPSCFYLFSAPAHSKYPTVLVKPGEGNIRELGDQEHANRRTLNQYIHENGVRSCQVVMGVTTLHEGNMWNTMPAHTHDRRTEGYLYFDVPAEARIVHLMGQPQETRHLIVGDKEAIVSPSWSIHSGVGTKAYSFVWAMAGENQAFDDMDTFSVAEMR